MEKTGKLHILAILENGMWMDLSQIRIMLQKDFGLKPNVDLYGRIFRDARNHFS